MHVNNIIKPANLHLHNIRKNCHHLTESTCKQLIQSLVISRLDYCNILLCNIPSVLLNRLQTVQNNAARLITLTKRQDHITPVLVELHWLPIKARIDYKVILTVYKALNGHAPLYIRDLLDVYVPKRSLRSEDKGLLVVPKTRLRSMGDRSFSCYAPKMWNTLPASLKDSPSVDVFKSHLKTYLFNLFYN